MISSPFPVTRAHRWTLATKSYDAPNALSEEEKGNEESLCAVSQSGKRSSKSKIFPFCQKNMYSKECLRNHINKVHRNENLEERHLC